MWRGAMMVGMASAVRLSTGSLDFSGGVDSNRVPTIASQSYPNGLKPNMLAWLENATVRGGGITPRRGFKKLARFPITGLMQEAQIYTPDAAFPYIMAQIAGRTFRCRVDTDNSIDEVTIPGDPNPADLDQAWMCQGEQFMVIQNGVNLPLFWDGATLRRSNGPEVSYGILAVAFNAPAIGSITSITLDDPYSGAPGQIFFIGSGRYQQVEPDSIATIQNNWGSAAGSIRPTPGTVIPAGTDFFKHLSAPPTLRTFTTLVDYITPAYLASIDVPVQLDQTFVGSILGTNYFRSPDPATQYAQIVTAIGYPPLGPNQIYVVNIDDVAGTPHSIGDTLHSQGELPAAEAMAYYMGRLWEGLGREYIAGDIVRGPSGTAQYGFRDSILKTTENTYLALGGTFIVPTNAGNIRAMSFPSNLDTALGEGQLLVFTRDQIYSVNVVPQRAAWATLSEPIQRVAQLNFGTTSDRSVVGANGDLFFQIPEGVGSLSQAIRYQGQWGNVPISSEEARAVDLNDRSLLRFGSGIVFDNRLYQTCLPFQTDCGVAHKGVLSLDFDTISTLLERLPPAWEGVLEGLDVLRLLKGNFGGRDRAFAIIRSTDGFIEVWELTSNELFDLNDSGEARITYVVETPSYTWDRLFTLKELDTMELWVDKVFGTVDFTVYMRPGQHPCWEYWHHWQICNPKNECELPNAPTPCNYPENPYQPCYKAMMTLPKPRTTCESCSGRPMNIDYSFQFKIVVHGYCRIRGLIVHAFERDRQPYDQITC